MRIDCKKILFALWFLSLSLGFAASAVASVVDQEVPPVHGWHQVQFGNHGCDAGFRSSAAYDAKLSSVTMEGLTVPAVITPLIPAYDSCPDSTVRSASASRAPPFGRTGFLAAKGPLRVDRAGLRLPPTRAEGADPFKLADQIKEYGTSTEGMPPIQVTRGVTGEMMINDGVTRATRGAMTPGTTVPVQVIEENPALNFGNLPRVGERTPGRP